MTQAVRDKGRCWSRRLYGEQQAAGRHCSITASSTAACTAVMHGGCAATGQAPRVIAGRAAVLTDPAVAAGGRVPVPCKLMTQAAPLTGSAGSRSAQRAAAAGVEMVLLLGIIMTALACPCTPAAAPLPMPPACCCSTHNCDGAGAAAGCHVSILLRTQMRGGLCIQPSSSSNACTCSSGGA